MSCSKQDKIVRHDDNVYEITSSTGNSVLTNADDNNIFFNNLQITKKGDELTFQYYQSFGYHTIYGFYRTKNGFKFYSGLDDRVTVEKKGNEISISSATIDSKGRIRTDHTKYLLNP